MPGHDGLTVRGVHVHHALDGGVLMLLQLTLARRGACLHRPLRTNLLCTGVALVADELDLLTGATGRPARRVRALLDASALLWALRGTLDLRRTWTGRHR